jgi:hypothetical protein
VKMVFLSVFESLVYESIYKCYMKDLNFCMSGNLMLYTDIPTR